MPCTPSQLNQYKYSQTSSGTTFNNVVVDRESGKAIVIQYPFFDLMMSGSSLSFRADSYRSSPDKLMLLLKCLLIIQTLPESALEEASEKLERIYRFCKNRSSQADPLMIPVSTIRSKLSTIQVRSPIVLEHQTSQTEPVETPSVDIPGSSSWERLRTERTALINQMRGFLKTDKSAPTDAEVQVMLEERLVEKYLQ